MYLPTDYHRKTDRRDFNRQNGYSVVLSAPTFARSQPVGRINALLKSLRRAVIGMVVMPALTGCGGPVSTLTPPAPSSAKVSSPQQPSLGNQEKQAAFLNQIRRADPAARTIDRALINEQNELGLILDRTVELEKIPALMRLMLTKMAAQFPGEDLIVLAYTPSNPPQKVGTARLDARTRDMTYTPE